MRVDENNGETKQLGLRGKWIKEYWIKARDYEGKRSNPSYWPYSHRN